MYEKARVDQSRSEKRANTFSTIGATAKDLFVNRSTGVLIRIDSRKLQDKRVAGIYNTDADIQGRAGGLRLRGGKLT